MGNHFGGVGERVYLGNLSCRRLLAGFWMLDAGSKILIVIFQFLIPEIEMADSLPVRHRTQTGNSALLSPLSELCTLFPPSSGFYANGVKLQSPASRSARWGTDRLYD